MLSTIVKNINDFISTSPLGEEIKSLPHPEDRLVLINNSFLFREKIKTNKSRKYIVFAPNVHPVTKDNCFIVEGVELRNDFKILKNNDSRIENKTPLEQALNDEIQALGEIVFVLMGEIDDKTEISVEIDHQVYDRLVFSPQYTDEVSIQDKSIKLKKIDSEDEVWAEIERLLNTSSETPENIESLKVRIGKSFDLLKKEAYLNLKLPRNFEPDESYFLELISKSIAEQVEVYEQSVKDMGKAATDRFKILNEVLRIAYNFVDDATTLIRLIISVCDLKPIILWGTFPSHYLLTESIKNLPWSKQDTKASISKYVDTIKKARNKSFHRLLPFSNAFEIQLPQSSLRDVSLRIFSEFGSKANRLEYKDKELVDVLMEFTRTSEEMVSDEFWIKNVRTMKATVDMLQKTAGILRLLKSAQEGI